MHLEDEFGDVVSKARRGLKMTPADLASMAGHGLTPDAVADIESYRLVPDDAAVAAIAQTLDLRQEALRGMAHGSYLPKDPMLDRWGCIAAIDSPYSDLVVNSYIVWDKETKDAALFDTGTDLDKIQEVIGKERLNPRLLALTHTHGDHVAVLTEVRATYGVRILASRAEPVRGAELIDDRHTEQLGDLAIQVLQTEGHSPGGLTFYVTGFGDAPGAAIVGDALFAGSAGGGNISYERLRRNISEKILSLPDETLVLPGHGPLTTIGQEKLHNPFAPRA